MSIKKEYDVAVIGGGTAGVIAAIQAARAGASTLLVEKNGMLGGTITVQGINFPASFFAWGKQIIRGIPWELCTSTLNETGEPLPHPDNNGRRSRAVHCTLNIPIYSALCDAAVLDAGADIMLHTMPAVATFADDAWKLTLCTKTGLTDVTAQVVIDSTGDANLVQLAGLDVNAPDAVQPATLQIHCSGYDPDTLDFEALNKASQASIAAGELKSTDISWTNAGPKGFLLGHGNNANHLEAQGAETSKGKTAAEIKGRQSVLRVSRFLRKQPGMENFKVDWICPETGIRETVRIKGKYTITSEDYESGRLFEDALCYGFYPIDEHLHDGGGINFRVLQEGVVPTVPRAALLPAGTSFMIVAGRCVSSDREANSGLRIECTCMAMGQAAGAMAALSAKTGKDPETLNLEDIHNLLRTHGAVVPGDN